MTDSKPATPPAGQHTRGQIQWQARRDRIELVTVGRGLVFVMGFARLGMRGAQPTFQVHKPECEGACRGCGVMHPATELLRDVDHNGWGLLDHPDAQRLVACWNGCDAANITDPSALVDLVEAASAIDTRCLADALNPCWDDRPSDVPGLHWGGGEACAPCRLRAALARVGGQR